MSRWLQFRIFLARLWVYFWNRAHGYEVWSKIHRLLFDRAARGLKLPTCEDPGEIAAYLRGMGWRADSWTDLGDAVCSPEMVWYRFLVDVKNHDVGDCDEFAIFSAGVITESIKCGTWKSVAVEPRLLSVTWFDAEGRAQGHNVCLVRWQSPESNVQALRAGATYGYMDYDLPMFYGEIERVVAAVRKRYAGPGYTGVCWAIHGPDMAFREVHWG